jgi:hypothetical protein
VPMMLKLIKISKYMCMILLDFFQKSFMVAKCREFIKHKYTHSTMFKIQTVDKSNLSQQKYFFEKGLLQVMLMLALLSSCSKRVKETIGIVTPGPNEYQVQRSKAIDVPPHYYLQKPIDTPNATDVSKVLTPNSTNLDEAEQALLNEVNNK